MKMIQEIITIIVAIGLGLTSNIVANYMQPKLDKRKKSVISIFIFLIVATIGLSIKKESTEKSKEENSNINVPTNITKKPCFIEHIIQENESVYYLCKKYSTTAEELHKLNPKVIYKNKAGNWALKPRYEIKIEIKC